MTERSISLVVARIEREAPHLRVTPHTSGAPKEVKGGGWLAVKDRDTGYEFFVTSMAHWLELRPAHTTEKIARLMPAGYVPYEQAAARLGLARASIYKYCCTGLLVGKNVSGVGYVQEASLDQFEQRVKYATQRPQELEGFISVEAAAQRLGIANYTVRKHRSWGLLEGQSLNGVWYIRESSLDGHGQRFRERFLAGRRRGARGAGEKAA